jgi:hypothetical protein
MMGRGETVGRTPWSAAEPGRRARGPAGGRGEAMMALKSEVGQTIASCRLSTSGQARQTTKGDGLSHEAKQ